MPLLLCVCTMLLLFCVTFVWVFCPCSGDNGPLHAYSPGDIIVGGLFPVHRRTNRSTTHGPLSCHEHDLQTLLHTQVMIYAINEVNQRTPRVLPNLTIGYDIYDTCGDVSFAIRATLQLLQSDQTDKCLVPESFQSALQEPRAKVVIGERISEVSVAVARVVALSSVAQISYSSTSEQLSRKLKFPTFLRTISSDEHQTKAIAALVKKFNWKTVAIVGSDDEYGKYGSDKIVEISRGVKDFCIEFTDILPGYFSKNTSQARTKLAELVSKINKSSAEAIILFTKTSNAEIIMEAAIDDNLNRTWIASDSWSTSARVTALPGIERAGQVFGFTSKRNEVPGFKEYVISKFNGSTNAILKQFFINYPVCSNQSERKGEGNCPSADGQRDTKKCLELSCLANHIDQDITYNIYLAVRVVVEGLRRLLKCDDRQCKRSGAFSASELLTEIKKVNFTVKNTRIVFDANGDPRFGYDILYWSMVESKSTHIETIGEYRPDGELKLPTDLVRKMHKVTVTAYNCSKTCKRGQELKIQGKMCCNDCVPCADGEFSAGNGAECKHCGVKRYSSPDRDKCLNKTREYLRWSDTFAIFLNCFASLGIVATLVLAVSFTIHHGTPIVKAVGGYLCFLELLSLLVCFCLTFGFIGAPTEISCKVSLPLFSIAFSLCMACILANLLQILVGFNFEQKIGSWIKKINQPLAVVTIVPGIQLALCVPWLLLHPPFPDETIQRKSILRQCDKGSKEFFIATVSYIAFLAVSCFLFAFKGKQLPDLYKNAKLITTSIMLLLIFWILFIPVYVNLVGKYRQGIESLAILISSYSILCCHLAPKCYIMVFRKEINNEKAITEYIRKHYEQKHMAVVKS